MDERMDQSGHQLETAEADDAARTAGRKEFSPKTKEAIAYAAGHKCAIRRCLNPTTTVNKTLLESIKDGKIEGANLGWASHIYAASKNGPRPAPPGVDVKHFNNGIWTCSGCGGKIDKVSCKFSAEEIFTMKRVREYAELMKITDPEIRALSRDITELDFDEVFWNCLPDFKDEVVRQALRNIAFPRLIQRVMVDSNSAVSISSKFALKSTSIATKTAVDAMTQLSSPKHSRIDDQFYEVVEIPSTPGIAKNDFAMELQRILEIEAGWAISIDRGGWRRNDPHRHDVFVEIGARNPKTGVECESSIRVRSTGFAHHTNDNLGEYLQLTVSTAGGGPNSNLLWRLVVTLRNGEISTSSTLEMCGNMSASGVISNSPGERAADFEAYCHVVEKLMEGWIPVGRVNRLAGAGVIADDMFPQSFDIEMQIVAHALEENLRLGKKMSLAQSIESDWGCVFQYTAEYFSPELDLQAIQTASDELRYKLGPPPYHLGSSKILATIGSRDIVLGFNGRHLVVNQPTNRKFRW